MHAFFGNDRAGCTLIGACVLIRTNTVFHIAIYGYSALSLTVPVELCYIVTSTCMYSLVRLLQIHILRVVII